MSKEVKYMPSEKVRAKFRNSMEVLVRGITDLRISERSMSQRYGIVREMNRRHQKLFGVSAVEVIYGDLDVRSLLK